MKSIRFAFTLSIALLCLASACADDDDTGSTDSSGKHPSSKHPDAGDSGAGSGQHDAAAAKADAATADAAPALCSGCPDEERKVGDNEVHFHHVHLNTQDPAASEDFYTRILGAEHVRLNNRADVLKADGAFLLLDEVDEEPTDKVDVGMEHFGWGKTDVLKWWSETKSKDGVAIDQRMGKFEEPFALFPNYYFIYLQGPSNERIEIETESEEYAQFKHVHFMTDDVNATVTWYEALLGTTAEMPEAAETTIEPKFNGMTVSWTINTIIVDKVKMHFFGPPYFGIPEKFARTDDHPLGHVAFAFADLDAVLERVNALDIEIVAKPVIDEAYGFRSFFVRGPNQVLIELVEAAQVPNP